MVTLKDFIELDWCIYGLDISIREPNGYLIEKHIFGVSGWPGNSRERVRENVYRECSYPREILIYLHPDPINYHQSGEPWGVITKKIPKRFLNMNIRHMHPFTAAFLEKEHNATYYSIDLTLDSSEPLPHPEPEQVDDIPDNITFDDIMEVNK